MSLKARSNGESCYLCEGGDNLEVHHLIPVIGGGTEDPSNLITLCGKCHMLVHGVKSKSRTLSDCVGTGITKIKALETFLMENDEWWEEVEEGLDRLLDHNPELHTWWVVGLNSGSLYPSDLYRVFVKKERIKKRFYISHDHIGRD